ncbi:MAG: primosomal protein N' [Ruminococcaceae bacterium]|nr:primosomal protein N' [Oscillospiraceae bacterium]
MSKEYALVYVLDIPYCIDRAYDYYLPPDLRQSVVRGSFVTVPFGAGNKRHLALVAEVKEKSEYKELKPILSLCPESLKLSEEMLGLVSFMKEMTLCTYGDAIHAMLPLASLSRFEEYYSITEKKLPQNPKGLDMQALFIYQYIKEHGRSSSAALKSRFRASAAEHIRKLCELGYLCRETELKSSEAGLQKRSYSLAASEEELKKALLTKNGTPRAPKCWVLAMTLLENGSMSEEELLGASKATKTQLKSLLDKGLVVCRTETVYRNVATAETQEKREITLNEEQQKVFHTLAGLFDSGKPNGALLYGVTGSGKTSVMLTLIDHVLAAGRGAIVLLPEIALTPQTLSIFGSRYGKRVAVLHSGLSGGERVDAYTLIKDGRADVVVGTRSAVFAPVKNLGLIIMDEEQEHTYKSDMSPKYHARDIARYRCAKTNSLMLLASATPSIESYKKAKDGVYTLVKLEKRYGNAKLPEVEVEDMRSEIRTGNIAPIGKNLAALLVETQKKKEQAILFLNRRGYNSFVTCRTCGQPLLCERCSVSLTYHTKRGSYDEGTLVCHMCGMRKPTPKSCPACGGEHLSFVGYGTQRVERDLTTLLPHAKILRMDTDTTATRSSYEDILGSFRRHEADILLGTQMVTKGHDFPDVTLVGVLLADASLYLDDYRAAERTFSLLTQVIGRAGRADKAGKAVIQTSNPDNEVIRLACAQDYEGFYEREIRLRKALTFPPFCDIALFNVISQDENELMLACKRFHEDFRARAMKEYPDMPLVVYGPFEAPVYKVDGKYRMRLVVKCRLNAKSRAFFASLLGEFTKYAGGKTTLTVDLNPTNL